MKKENKDVIQEDIKKSYMEGMSLLNSADVTKNKKVRILKQKANYLYKTGKSFTFKKSGSSYELESNMWNGKAFKSGFTPEDLTFIKSVKKHVLDNCIALDFMNTCYKETDIDYMHVREYEVGEVLNDMIYIDINGAYWQTAYKLGIISERIFKNGWHVSKVVRLAALGSLARKKKTYVFDGKEFTSVVERKSYATENLWFAICKKVSDVMMEAVEKLGDNYVFYWVDGIYIKNSPKSIQTVISVFTKHGYSSKMELVPEIRFLDNGFEVQGAMVGDLKHFTWVQGEDNKPLTKYVRNMELLNVAKELLYPNKKKHERKNLA